MEELTMPHVFAFSGVAVPSMACANIREATFSLNPNHWMDPKVFAAAGFFYSGTRLNSDKLVCYSCGLVISLWSPGDDPYVEHAIFQQYCAHLYLLKGLDWIDNASQGNPVRLFLQPQGDSNNSNYPKCVICLDNDIGCLYLNCGHMVTCKSCGASVDNCPLCRINITYVVRGFLP